MCLAKVYLRKNNRDELVLENVATVQALETKVIVTSILRETKEVYAVIKEVDVAESNIFLECQS